MASIAESPPCLPRRGRKADDPRMIGPWKVGRTLGKGSSGRVKIARHAKTGQYAAVKIVSKIHLVNSRRSIHDLGFEAERILLGIEREIVIMKLINHPNIMRLYDVWETSGELYMILEYIEGGELFDYIVEKGRLPPAEALDYFQQLISAMDYCHRFNIAHRDLKPENLLLDKDKRLKVADFGMAAWQKSDNDLLETSCGSPHYAAPEVIRGEPYDGSASDIWSCGVILFALLAGRLPFDDENIDVLLNKVKIGKFVFPPDMDKGAQSLIANMLQVDVKKRINFAGILADPWFNSRPHRDTRCTPPSIDELAKPITCAADVDSDIFGNLRTLWNGASDEEIMQGLTNEKQTWEKVVYHLLMQYRSAQLENLNLHNQRANSRRRSEKENSKRSKRKPEVPETPKQPPSRPDPPTPRKAAERHREENVTPTSVSKSPAQNDSYARTSSVRTSLPLTGPSTRASTHNQSADHTSILSPASLLSPNSPLSPCSPIWEALDMPPINVPEIHDENVQHFFQQIVDHLNAMQNRTSLMSPVNIRSPNFDSPRVENPSASLRVPPRLVLNDAKAPPPTPAGEFHRGPATPSDGLSPVSDNFGLGIVAGGRENKENEHGSKKGRNLLKKSSLRTRSKDGERPALADRRVQIVVPPKISRIRDELMSPTISDGSSNFSVSSQKRSWFTNLFKFRPAVFELMSMQDAVTTREECKRLLVSFGVRVILAQAEAPGVLKCMLDEIRDPSGAVAVVKSVAFRVEFRSVSDLQRKEGHGGYAGVVTAVEMIQEKGALSSFKLIYNRLRRDWVLDTNANTPMVLPSPVLDEECNGRFLEVPSFSAY